jgi:hypothetical protein
MKYLAKSATVIFFDGAGPEACLIKLLMFDMIFVWPKLAIDFLSLSASTGSVGFCGNGIAGFLLSRFWPELWKGSGGKRTPFPNV